MLKIEKEYIESYGSVPENEIERFSELVSKIDFHKSRKNVIEEVKRINRIEWKELSYVIYLVPKATPRPKTHGNMFYVHGARENRQIFQKFMKNQDIKLITTPCKFYCKTYHPIPKAMSNVEKILAELGFIRPVSKPDFDNLAKSYCDMCQGFLIYDDCQIIKGVSEKYYSTKPRIEITIKYMADYDCGYNKKKIRGKD